jgi:hypothetical protein
MSFLRPMLKNRCTFNELEFRRMAEHAIQKAIPQQPQQIVDAKLYKTTKKTKISLIFWEYFRNDSDEERAINFL